MGNHNGTMEDTKSIMRNPNDTIESYKRTINCMFFLECEIVSTNF
jgi:hypothetical protein